MTSFDFIVLIIVGVAAVGGFMRGFVQEVLSLATWALAVFAIHYLHTPLTEAFEQFLGEELATSILAFAMLLLIPYAGMKLIAGRFADRVGGSIVAPIDRVLGFGFGALKGAVIVVIAFALLVLGYDSTWGYKGRPGWITNARTYPMINAAVDETVLIVAERRAKLKPEADGEE